MLEKTVADICINGEGKGILNIYFSFCATRWVEDEAVTERAIKLCRNIVKLVKHWQGLSKRQHPKSKCYQTLVKHHLDKFIPIKLQFFQDIAAQHKGFLQKFQTNKLMVPFLESALVDLLHTIMKMVVKPEVLDEANSSLKLAKLDLSNSSNLLLCKLMKLPTAAKSLLRSAGLSNEKRRSFLKNCKEVFVVLI